MRGGGGKSRGRGRGRGATRGTLPLGSSDPLLETSKELGLNALFHTSDSERPLPVYPQSTIHRFVYPAEDAAGETELFMLTKYRAEIRCAPPGVPPSSGFFARHGRSLWGCVAPAGWAGIPG